jgi:flavin reductase (DIM6/NTAB) family NADH-FMN oxidoreductase RutF
MATYALREAVNICGQEVPEETDEFDLAGVTKAQSHIVKPPCVAESPVHFECAYYSTLRLPGGGPGASGSANLVIGRVLCVHIEDEVLTEDGRLDILKLRPLARLGYYDYTSVESIFEMVIPGGKRRGMEGVTGGQRE